MRMVLIVNLHHSRFVYFGPGSKKWCHDDRSRASTVSVSRHWPVVASAMEVPDAGGTPEGVAGVEAADAGPSSVIAPGACCKIWWCMTLVQAFLGVSP
jgi:hypothetical protein